MNEAPRPPEEPILITADMIVTRPKRNAPRADGKVDFERGMARFPWLVMLLIAANVVVFVGEVASGAFMDRKAMFDLGIRQTQQSLLETGALVRERVLAGEWWRVFSSMFLHGGPDHIIGNMVVLYIVGMACQHAFGAMRFALVYLGSGVAGAALSMAMKPGPSVGASGAIFGVVAAVVVVLYRHQDRFYVRDKRIGFVLAIWAAWQLLTGFLTPYIDNFAHLGGIVGGAAVALVLTPRLVEKRTVGR